MVMPKPLKKRYAFMRNNKKKWFGPYDTVSDARDAFQRAYGYWPGALVDEELWNPPGEKKAEPKEHYVYHTQNGSRVRYSHRLPCNCGESENHWAEETA